MFTVFFTAVTPCALCVCCAAERDDLSDVPLREHQGPVDTPDEHIRPPRRLQLRTKLKKNKQIQKKSLFLYLSTVIYFSHIL